MGLLVRSVKSQIGWPAPGWAPTPGATRSITDIIVNSDTAMTVGAWHAGVRLIAEDIAGLPLGIFKKVGDSRIAQPDHPSYAALHSSPNPEMTAMVWRETMIGHLLTWGNCYSEKEFNGLGQTVRLWPLRPDRMRVTRNRDSGQREYHYQLPNGTQAMLPNRNVLHVPGFGFDGLIGYSRISMARRSLESAIALEEYGLRTFAEGANPGVTILSKNQLSREAKKNIVESWDEGHRGLTNAQRTAILDEGMSLEKLSFPPEDAQFLESKKHSVEEIARWLRLAPTKLSDFTHATFSNLEETSIDHVVSALMPTTNRFEQQYGKDILAPPFYAKHNLAALMRGNSASRAAFYHSMRGDGTLTDDEIRAFEDLNPLTDEDRAKVLWPLNSVPSSAYDANGMTVQQRVDAVGVLVRAGYDPTAALTLMNLDPIEHTGLVPVTIQMDPLTAPKNGTAQGAPVP